MPVTRKSFSKALQSLNETSRTITFVASSEIEDRYGDIVRVNGIDTKAYAQNPVVLFAHDASQTPVAKCVGIEKTANQLLMTCQFATAEENPQADTVFKLYKGGFLNAVSIGFLAKTYEMRMDAESGMPAGYDFTSTELLELSCVPVPANSEALAKDLNTSRELEDFLRKLLVPETDPQMDAFLQQLTAKP